MYTEAKSAHIQNGGRDWSLMPNRLRNGTAKNCMGEMFIKTFANNYDGPVSNIKNTLLHNSYVSFLFKMQKNHNLKLKMR